MQRVAPSAGAGEVCRPLLPTSENRKLNGIRIELAERGTQVTGLFVGSPDTDMVAGFDVEKNRPEDVVRTALDGLEAGLLEVLADEASVNVKAALALDPAILYPGVVRSA